MSDPVKVAVIGLGKIAQDQHLPAIAQSPDFKLVAVASPAGLATGVPNFPSFEALLGSAVPFDAVALCQPPQARFQAAALALRAKKHVLLEKPPGASTLEVDQLQQLATESGTTLFSAWHSRFAPAVEPARTWLAARRVRSVVIEWREDVRHWHPGQAWIWEPGGLGVFDPGINALSILTCLITEPLRLLEGTLDIPHQRFTPIAAELHLRSLSDIPVHAVFDWRQTGPQIWMLSIETDAGRLTLSDGGAALQVNERQVSCAAPQEYPALYARFAALIRMQASEVDVAPLRLVADAFMRCRARTVEAFE